MFLIVEDEPAIRLLLEEGFMDAGVEVMLACDGEQAIAKLNARPGGFEALVTDIRLGAGPDGWEVGRLARKLAPGMAVVYVSGDSGYDWPLNGVAGSAFFDKPFGLSQIVSAALKLLAEARTLPAAIASSFAATPPVYH